MKLSTKGRYGLRAMVTFAANSSVEHVALYSIAERQRYRKIILNRFFSILRKAGLVKSVKGAQGGYILADNPSNIKVGAILRALEGNLSVVDEEAEYGDSPANSIQHCLKVNIWDRINDSINKIVDSMTLEDLVNEYRKINGENTADVLYMIFFILNSEY